MQITFNMCTSEVKYYIKKWKMQWETESLSKTYGLSKCDSV